MKKSRALFAATFAVVSLLVALATATDMGNLGLQPVYRLGTPTPASGATPAINALGTPTPGNVRFCTNCAATSPCTSGGNGAIARAEDSPAVWNCGAPTGVGTPLPTATPQPTATAPPTATPQPTSTPLAFNTPGKVALFGTAGANFQPYAGFTPSVGFVTGLDGFGAPTLATPVPPTPVPGAATATPQPTPTLVATATPQPTATAQPTPTVIATKYWLPVAACQNATAGLLWDSPTSSPAVATCVTGTNTQKGVADFAAASNLSLQITLLLPSNFNSSGTVTATFVWFTSTTSGNVVWNLATACTDTGASATDDPSFNAADAAATTAAPGTTNRVTSSAISSVTKTGCAASNVLHLKASRNAGAGSDTMSGTARLIGVELTVPRT